MGSPNRDQMAPESGKMLDDNDEIFDLTKYFKNGGGGSSVGGGLSLYSSFGDFTATANEGFKTITLTELPPALASLASVNFGNAVIRRRNSAGEWDVISTNGSSYVNATGVLTLDMAENFAAGDEVSVMLVGPDKQVVLEGLNQKDDIVTAVPKGCVAVPLTASGVALSGGGQIIGFYVNSTSGGTIRFSDAVSATTPYLGGTITPDKGWNPFPAEVNVGVYATIANTLDVTVFVIAN